MLVHALLGDQVMIKSQFCEMKMKQKIAHTDSLAE
jgi:hypothetical protein